MENAQTVFLNFLVEVPCIPVNHVKSFCSTLSKRMWRMLCLRNRSNWQCLIQFMIIWPSEDVLWGIWHAIFSYTLSFNFSWPDCRFFLGACPSWQCIWCHSFSEIALISTVFESGFYYFSMLQELEQFILSISKIWKWNS